MDLETLDLDDLKALIEVLRDGGVVEFALGGLSLRLPPPAAPQISIEAPAPAVDRLNTTAPSAYVRLLGPNLPQWPKAE